MIYSQPCGLEQSIAVQIEFKQLNNPEYMKKNRNMKANIVQI